MADKTDQAIETVELGTLEVGDQFWFPEELAGALNNPYRIKELGEIDFLVEDVHGHLHRLHLTNQVERRNLHIVEWLSGGTKHLDQEGFWTVQELLHDCGRIMDKHCVGEILGPVVFKAADGRHYIAELVTRIGLADPHEIEEARNGRQPTPAGSAGIGLLQ